jgi:hypothetical protein
MKVKTELPAVRIAKRTGSCAYALPVLIIIMVLGSELAGHNPCLLRMPGAGPWQRRTSPRSPALPPESRKPLWRRMSRDSQAKRK